MSHPLLDRHRETLEKALTAIHERSYFSAYPEVPSGKIYGENARAEGQAAFDRRLGAIFPIAQPGGHGSVGSETSPYGIELGVTYPQADLDELLAAVTGATAGWRRASIDTRLGICLEILHRLNQRSFEMALAVMHTTGQGYMMAFQAGGPHAQDRGLEAVAYAAQALRDCPSHAEWRKRVSKTDFVTLRKSYRVVPRGVALTIGCSTFPTWNGYPGIFASLATGNAVVIKPHPGAVLPLAITAEIAREVLAEEGFDPNVVTLVVDTHEKPVTRELALRPEIGVIDYTGSSAFGSWLEENARQAVVFTEKAGVNCAVLDSVDDLKAVTGNLAFTLSLYAGQMCTTTQNIFVPRGGIDAGGQQVSFDDAAGAIVKAVDWLLGDPKRAAEVLGCLQNEQTERRIDEARAEVEAAGARILRESTAVAHEQFPEARIRSPLIVAVEAGQEALYMREMFGPIVYIVATDSTAQSIELAARAACEQGAITGALYSTDPGVLEAGEDALTDAGVALSCNLTGQIYVNQAAAFSDFHVSGHNPAGNATLCDAAFVASRFRVVQSRVPVPEPAAVEA
ncbi:MAG: phenylacetic acid degradation protein PaaN [Planctomycetota bacterium]